MQNTSSNRTRSLQSEDFCAYNLQCGPWEETAEWLTYDRNTDLSLYVNHKTPTQTSCSTGTSCGCSARDIVYQETNEIILPYYYNKVEMYESQTYNYTEYDLFALKTRLLPEIQKIDSSYTVRFDVREYDNKMYNVVEIYSGSEFVPLLGELYEQIRDIVADALDKDITSYSLLIHGEFPIEYKDVCLPSAWLSSILRILFMPETKCKKVLGIPTMRDSCRTVTMGSYYIIDSKVYVDLTDFTELYSIYGLEDLDRATYKSFSNLYHQLYKRLLNYLIDIYKLGSIVLNTDNEIIRDFELQPLVMNVKMGLGIYMANYRTHHLRDPTRFLYKVLLGDRYIMAETTVLEKLKEVGFDVKENIVFIRDYRDLQIVWYWTDKVY